MGIQEYYKEIIACLSELDYISDIEFYQVDEYSFKGKAKVKKSYILSFRFKHHKSRLTVSFFLLFENERIWGLDRDNQIGWHIHPLGNSKDHIEIEEKTISEIIGLLDETIQRLSQ